MDERSDGKLDRLLREAYPAVEVSPDFTLRLWRRLMKHPVRPPWMLPVPAYGVAVAVGLLLGVWGGRGLLQTSPFPTLPVGGPRWDLFGNAPVDSLAGNYLGLMVKGRG